MKPGDKIMMLVPRPPANPQRLRAELWIGLKGELVVHADVGLKGATDMVLEDVIDWGKVMENVKNKDTSGKSLIQKPRYALPERKPEASKPNVFTGAVKRAG